MNSADLAYEVFINEPPKQDNGKLPSGEPKSFPPLASTLIYGTRSAVLVDPGFTTDAANALGDWVAGKGRDVSDIFITHGHGDHWFASGLLAERFGARTVATEGTIGQMHANVAGRPYVWDKVYDGIPPSPVTAVTAPNNTFTLESRRLDIVEVGHTEIDASSVLHVPDLELVVAGDVIYNGAHLYLSETSLAGLDKWRAAIDRVESLGVDTSSPATKTPNSTTTPPAHRNDPRAPRRRQEAPNVEKAPVDYYNAMITRYPEYQGRTVLWSTAQAVYGIRENPGKDPVKFIAGGWL